MDAEHQYVRGQGRPGFPALLAEYERRSLAAAGGEFDIAYGPHPRQRYDWFPAEGAARATILYFHPGYWQSRDKAGFRFIAPPLAADGFDVALVNYPLCPGVRITELIEAARAAVAPIRERGAPLILAGHSAGGQIAVELGLSEQAAGVFAISGVFDLEPLIGTSLNAALRLDRAEAVAASPVHRAAAAAPGIFAVGETETDAFREQSAAMCSAWAAAGNDARLITVAGADHFTILRSLTDDDGEIRRALSELAP